MPFCSKCGAAVEGRFCAQCGSPVTPAAEAGPAAVPTPLPAAAGLTDNVAGALCYALLLITGVLFLVMAPYNQNRAVRFHALQSILLHVAMILAWYGGVVVLNVIHLGFLLFPLFLGCVALWLYMMISTYQGKTVVLPVIGPFAQQQAGK